MSLCREHTRDLAGTSRSQGVAQTPLHAEWEPSRLLVFDVDSNRAKCDSRRPLSHEIINAASQESLSLYAVTMPDVKSSAHA